MPRERSPHARRLSSSLSSHSHPAYRRHLSLLSCDFAKLIRSRENIIPPAIHSFLHFCAVRRSSELTTCPRARVHPLSSFQDSIGCRAKQSAQRNLNPPPHPHR